MVIEVNVVRVPEDADFEYVRRLCETDVGWSVVYSKKQTRVAVKPVVDSNIHMIKACATFAEISASTAYDVLHDAKYRSTWDKYMLGAKDIGLINPNNDICYYSLRSFPPFRSRDFVLQRSWLDLGFGHEKLIFSHSVCHDDFPPSVNCIRATVFLTGFLVRPLANGHGCQLYYVTHSDPGGHLPAWMINRLTQIVAPKMIKRLHKACQDYAIWKSDHSPNEKPWLYADQQMCMPRVRLDQCRPRIYEQIHVDESRCDEVAEAADEAVED